VSSAIADNTLSAKTAPQNIQTNQKVNNNRDRIERQIDAMQVLHQGETSQTMQTPNGNTVDNQESHAGEQMPSTSQRALLTEERDTVYQGKQEDLHLVELQRQYLNLKMQLDHHKALQRNAEQSLQQELRSMTSGNQAGVDVSSVSELVRHQEFIQQQAEDIRWEHEQSIKSRDDA